MSDEIKTLKRKRDSLSIRIRECVNKNRNAYKYVVEHNRLTNLLKEMGCNVSIQTEHLKIENWTPDGYKYGITKPSKAKSKKDEQPIKETPKPKIKQDSFILCLAWTEVTGSPEPIQLKKVKDYFEELCLPVLDNETRKINETYTEHILKYEFKGSEEAFRLLKICTQFVLDSFAETDFDKFNIAIYGKKKNF